MDAWDGWIHGWMDGWMRDPQRLHGLQSVVVSTPPQKGRRKREKSAVTRVFQSMLSFSPGARVHRRTHALHRPENPSPQGRVRCARHTLINIAGAMVGRAPAEQPASPTAVLAHNLNLPFPPGAHAFIFSAALTLGVALSGARAAAGPSLVAPEWPPPPLAAPAAPERRQPRPQRPPPPPPPAERNPAPPRAVPPRTAHLRISKSSVTRNKQYLPTQLVRDLLAGVNDGGTVTLVSQGGAAPGAPRTVDVV